MAREKQRGKKRNRNESPFFIYLKGEASAMGYHGDPRPERPQPIGRDVGANEKARCWRVLRWLPGGTLRTGEYGCLRGWPLGSRVTGSGKTGCQERGSKRGRPHGLSAELVKPLVRPAKPLTGPVGASAEPASALL